MEQPKLPQRMRVYLNRTAQEAVLLRNPEAIVTIAPSAGRGGGTSRNAKPMRIDVADLPLVEWDGQLVGQRARCLVADGEWMDAFVMAFLGGQRAYRLLLADGSQLERGLPDYRVVLAAEGDTELGTEAVSFLATEPPPEAVVGTNADPNLDAVPAVGTAAVAGTASAEAAAEAAAEGSSAAAMEVEGQEAAADAPPAQAVIAEPLAPVAEPSSAPSSSVPARPLLLYRSSLTATGYRGVRPSAALRTPTSASGYELAVYVDGREKTSGPYSTVLAAAHEYRRLLDLALDADGRLMDHSRAAGIRSTGGSRAGGDGGGGGGSAAGAIGGKRKGKELSIVWDETIVGRRIRAFFPGSGEWMDGTLISCAAPARRPPRRRQVHGRVHACAHHGASRSPLRPTPSVFHTLRLHRYAPPARAARKEGAKFTASYDDGETEELSLPDESVRLLPEGCGQGAEAPPLTREDEKRAYKCQAQLAEDAARAEIEVRHP
jgi:hypothetical protein